MSTVKQTVTRTVEVDGVKATKYNLNYEQLLSLLKGETISFYAQGETGAFDSVRLCGAAKEVCDKNKVLKFI